MDISVHLLAGVRVVRDGRVRPVTSRQQRIIVAALALSPGRSVSADQLIDALWDDDPPEGARATLQSYVSRLRRMLGADAILHGPAGYRLPEEATSDLALAHRLADEAREAMPADPGRAFDKAHEALGLWDGPALAELANNPWFTPAASGLDELRANLVDLAGEALVAGGRPAEAVELLDPVVRSNPLREPSHVRLVDALRMSGRTVDGVRVATRYRRALRDQTGLEPGAELVAAEQRALAGDDDLFPSRDLHEADARREWRSAVLPRPNRLIGRDVDIAEVLAALSTARLVTICGPGGVGKSRLVAELVETCTDVTPSIVVELAPARVGEVAAAVGAALRMRADRASSMTIAERLRAVQAVLVLDSVEHVLEEVRALARALLDRCPLLRLLVTSRARLNLPDERVYALNPLATDGERSPAVELFLERLAQGGRTFGIHTDTADLVAICVRLDGLPLALELAAGRAATLGIDGLYERLDSGLDLIAVAAADHDRHASLRRVVAWSYELLDESSRRLVSALAVFNGEFDLDAAEQVGSGVMGHPVSLVLSRLVDSSLVATTGNADRYRLLEAIRNYSRERLEEAGDSERAAVIHATWTAQHLAEIDSVVGPAEAAISARLDALRDEIRGALRWAPDATNPRLAAALVEPLAGPLLYRPDAELIDAGRTLVARVLARPAEWTELHPALPAAGARLAFLAGDLADVDHLAKLAISHRDGDAQARHRAHHARGVLRLYHGRHLDAISAFATIVDAEDASVRDKLDALGGLGLAYCYSGQHHDAQLAVDRHSAIAHTIDSDTHLAFGEYVQGEIDLAGGDVTSATRRLSDAAERASVVGATFIWGIAATTLASVLVRHRPLADARAHLPVLLERWRDSATWPQLWTTLRLVAELLAAHGDDDCAALILLAADRDTSATFLTGPDLDRDTVLRQTLRQRIGDARYAGIATGVGMLPRGDVFDRALDALRRLETGPRPRRARTP